ncbi:MAG: DNA translocase FtsK 4TM domain-containing protein, partial [Candidatus Omnitrophica bacterium]|nr:DNA translocase FtsK 4TM domain-containing protein [Candidatus Omnitrophota bacterium]
MKEKRINELKGLLVLAVGIIMLASLVSFCWEDLKPFSFPYNLPPRNWIRGFGAYLAGILFFFFGWSSYLIFGYIIWTAIRLFKNHPLYLRWVKVLGFFIFLVSISAILSLFGPQASNLKFFRAGLLGMVLEETLNSYFGRLGSFIIFITFAILSFSLLSDILVSVFFLNLLNTTKKVLRFLRRSFLKTSKKKISVLAEVSVQKKEVLTTPQEAPSKPKITSDVEPQVKEAPLPKIKIRPKEEKKEKVVLSTKASVLEVGEYKFPSLDLLDSPPPLAERQIKEDLTANARILEETLADFGISAKVTHIERGPVITRYELEPAAGVKLQRIVSLSDDIA